MDMSDKSFKFSYFGENFVCMVLLKRIPECPRIEVLMFFENVRHNFLLGVNRKESFYGILFSCAISMCGKVLVIKLWSKILSSNQIVRFICQQYLLN